MKVRTFVLKTLAVWTFLPLLYLEKETTVKHTILIIDILLSLGVFLQVEITSRL
jgi:hypothetical protein